MKNHHHRVVCAGLAIAVCSAAASAQLTAVPQFTGASNEPFTPQGGFNHCLASRVFDNTADLCTFDGAGGVATGAHVTSGWGFSCSIQPFSAPSFFGSAGGIATYTFDSPVGKFGGFMGSNSEAVITGGGGFARFFDESNVLIGEMPIPLTVCGQWEWHGWETSTPAKKIEVHSSAFGGAFLMMDDMTYDLAGGGSCYANCDGSTVEPVLNVDDFTCFINEYAAASALPAAQQLTAYANCDGSTVEPVLNVDDFTCFINQYAQGCP